MYPFPPFAFVRRVLNINNSLRTLHDSDSSTVATQGVVSRPSRIVGGRVSKLANNLVTLGSGICEVLSSLAGRNKASHPEVVQQISRKA